ncbi:MAG: tripartite tricarboxylate transporter substrate binding protein [Proteobacteria bacterium]|nr:tripartite tricarboxylate transporter substrate binding protein [Pseudomonadota bacterium]
MITRRSSLAGVATLLALGRTAHAQDKYPIRPIKMIVPFAAGGPADVVGRIVAAGLGEKLGQQVVVENKSGAGVVVGTAAVATAPSDGYTLLLSTIAHSIAPSMFKTLPYDPVKDFTPVGLVGSVPLVMVVRPSLEAKDVKEVVALARAKPNTLNFGSAGNGAVDDLSASLFETRTGTTVVHVKYRGTAPAIQDLLAGRLDCIISTSSVMLPHIQSGALRALAVTYPTRLPTLPSVPTMAEAGIPDFDMSAWYSLLLPARTAPGIVDRLNRVLKETLADKATQARLQDLGTLISSDTSPEYLARYMADEQARWAGVLKAAGYQPE